MEEQAEKVRPTIRESDRESPWVLAVANRLYVLCIWRRRCMQTFVTISPQYRTQKSNNNLLLVASARGYLADVSCREGNPDANLGISVV